MAANEDRKGITGANKSSKVAAGIPAKPAAVRGRPRKVTAPATSAEEAKLPAATPVSKPAPKPAAAKAPSVEPAIKAAPPAPPAAKAPEVATQVAAEPEPPVPSPAADVTPPVDVDEVEPFEVAKADVKEADATETEIDKAQAEATKVDALAQEIPAGPELADADPPAGFAFAGLFTPFMLEDTMMEMSPNFSGFQDAMTEAQAKAKAAFEKSTSMLGEVSDFTKGNVEAIMESGKILAEGVQGIGSELVTEGRSTFETMTGDIKELAGAKSPTDFFKIQGEMMRKNFDSAVAYGSKNSEAMLKLMSDAMAPISGRVSIAMEKARSVSV